MGCFITLSSDNLLSDTSKITQVISIHDKIYLTQRQSNIYYFHLSSQNPLHTGASPHTSLKKPLSMVVSTNESSLIADSRMSNISFSYEAMSSCCSFFIAAEVNGKHSSHNDLAHQVEADIPGNFPVAANLVFSCS